MSNGLQVNKLKAGKLKVKTRENLSGNFQLEGSETTALSTFNSATAGFQLEGSETTALSTFNSALPGFHLGAFNAGNKSLKHPGYFYSFIRKMLHFFGRNHLELSGNICLRPEFGNRPFGNIKKLNKFFFSLPFGTFRDIGRDGDCRTGNLGNESVIFAAFKYPVRSHRKLAASLPYIKIFKILFHLNEYNFQLSSFNFHLSTQGTI